MSNTHSPETVWSRGRPWIIGKAAMSLDGKMSRPAGEDPTISSEPSRRDVQRLRARCDAILIGAETARRDNPRLTIRDLACDQQPWRVIVTRSNDIPNDLNILCDPFRHRTLIYSNQSWQTIWTNLFERGVRTLLVEGGGQILDQLAEAGWMDESVIYYAPIHLEHPNLVTAEVFRQLPLAKTETVLFDDDIRLSGRVLKTGEQSVR